ncbi:MAG: hypothetical protein JWO04_3099 [Gammaproteobacteria bacterium]|nr:hypothetical protein [Gammaproteobacteria bacterium]
MSRPEDERVKTITLGSELNEVPPIALRPGQTLRGDSQESQLGFEPGSDGRRLSAGLRSRLQENRWAWGKRPNCSFSVREGFASAPLFQPI